MSKKYENSAIKKYITSTGDNESDSSDSALLGSESFRPFRRERIGDVHISRSSDNVIGNQVRVVNRSQRASNPERVSSNQNTDDLHHRSSENNATFSVVELSDLFARPLVQTINMIAVLVIVCLVKYFIAKWLDSQAEH